MRLIDADELFLKLSEKIIELYKEEAYEEARGMSKAKTFLSTHPTVEAEPVRHGYWDKPSKHKLNGKFDCLGVVCSLCKTFSASADNYCPYCGAKMDSTLGNESKL